MAELPRLLTTQQVTRSRGAGQLRSVPTTPRVPAGSFTAGVEATSALGGTVGQATTQILTLVQQLQKARDDVQQTEAFASALQILETSRSEVLRDREVFPLDMDTTFAARVGPQMQDLEDGLSSRARAGLRLQIARQQASIVRGLTTEGQKRFVTRGTNAFDQTVEGLQRQLLQSDNAVDDAQLFDTLREVTETAVANGLIDAGTGVARLRLVEDEVQVQRMQALIRLDPEAAEQMLEARLRGEPPQPGEPNVPPDQLVALFDIAQTEVTQRIEAQERQDDLEEQALSEAENAFLLEQDAVLSDPRATLGAISRTRETIVRRCQAEGFSATLCRTRETYALKRIEDLRNPSVDNAETLRVARSRVYGATLLATREEVMSLCGAGLKDTTCTTMLNAVASRERQDHFSNLPQWGQTVSFLSDQLLGSPGDIIALDNTGFATVEELRKAQRERFGQAEAVVFNILSTMTGPRGIDTDEFQRNWFSIASTVVEQFRSSGPDPGLPRFPTQQDAVLAWMAGEISREEAVQDVYLHQLGQRFRARQEPPATRTP